MYIRNCIYKILNFPTYNLFYLNREYRLSLVVPTSDVDPNPVGSAFISVRESGSAFRIRIQRCKMKGKAEFNQIFFYFFVGNYVFQV